MSAAGSLDVSCNAISLAAVQGIPLVELPLEDFMTPITLAARTHFVTATAAARRMTAQGSGVIVMLSSSAARESRHRMGGFNLACASIEALTRSLAGEVGRDGVRVVSPTAELHARDGRRAAHGGRSPRPLLDDTLLGRLPLLAEVGAAQRSWPRTAPAP